MRRRTVICIMSLLAFAIVVVLGVWHNATLSSENQNFGLMHNKTCQNIKLVDGSEFELRYLGMRPQAHAAAEFELTQLSSDKLYTFGGACWEENEMCGVDAPYAEVYTEVDEKRVLLHTDGYDNIVGSPPDAKDYLLSFPRSVVTASVPLPFYEGTFYLTLYVRECEIVGVDSYGSIYSSVGDPIPLTVQIDNPPATNKPFDIVEVTQSRTAAVIWMRCNDKSRTMPYLDSTANIVEQHVGTGYERTASDEIYELSEYDYHLGNVGIYSVDITTRSELELGADIALFPVMFPAEWLSTDADYRLTLEFCENPDGTGERYTLRLRLKFSE